MDLSLNIILYLIICLILVYELYKSKITILKLYIFSSICIVGILISKNIYFTIIIALLSTYILDTLIDSNTNNSAGATITIESMQNKKGKNNKKIKQKSKELNYLMGDISGLLKDIKLNTKEVSEPYSKSNKYYIDKEKTKKNVYKKMNKKQKSGLQKDTLELINTQKELMNTMKEMGPVLSQGKNIMKTFDQYFGSKDTGKGKDNDLSYIMDRMKKMNIT